MEYSENKQFFLKTQYNAFIFIIIIIVFLITVSHSPQSNNKQYRVILPYKEPVTKLEKMLFLQYNGDPVKYMEALRIDNKVSWATYLRENIFTKHNNTNTAGG